MVVFQRSDHRCLFVPLPCPNGNDVTNDFSARHGPAMTYGTYSLGGFIEIQSKPRCLLAVPRFGIGGLFSWITHPTITSLMTEWRARDKWTATILRFDKTTLRHTSPLPPPSSRQFVRNVKLLTNEESNSLSSIEVCKLVQRNITFRKKISFWRVPRLFVSDINFEVNKRGIFIESSLENCIWVPFTALAVSYEFGC